MNKVPKKDLKILWWNAYDFYHFKPEKAKKEIIQDGPPLDVNIKKKIRELTRLCWRLLLRWEFQM